MEPNTITQLISNMGFPIAMCLLMYYQNSKYIASNTDALNSLKSVIERMEDNNGKT